MSRIRQQGPGHADEARQLHKRAPATRLPGRPTWRWHEPTDPDGQDRSHHRHRTDVETLRHGWPRFKRVMFRTDCLAI